MTYIIQNRIIRTLKSALKEIAHQILYVAKEL